MTGSRRWLGLTLALLLCGCGSDHAGAPGPEPAGPEDVVPVQSILDPAPRDDVVRSRIEAAVRHARQRQLKATDAFWTVFHGILGLGPSVPLLDPATGQRVKAIDYICAGRPMPGLVLHPTKEGVDVSMGPEAGGLGVSQGHRDQFAAEMAQWNLPADQPFVVGGKPFKFLDFVRYSQKSATTDPKHNPDQKHKLPLELSWSIVIIGQYLGTDARWTNVHGEKLHFDDLIRYELSEDVERTAACGGTHRLFGLTWAHHLHLQRGGKAEGVWADVAAKNAHYCAVAQRDQMADGSFSNNYLIPPPLNLRRPKVPGGDGAFPSGFLVTQPSERFRRINTTGHVFEYLALSLPDEELRQPWMSDAANALSLMILDIQDPAFDGMVYHAVHGLYLYYARVYGRRDFVPAEMPVPLPPSWKQVEGAAIPGPVAAEVKGG